MLKIFAKDKKGQSLVEFALVLPLLLLILFGITEFGRAIMTKNVLHSASREGARLAVVSAVDDSVSVQNRVLEILQAANIDPKEIKIEFFPADKSIKVTVTTDFEVLSGTIISSFVGILELKGFTVMKYEG